MAEKVSDEFLDAVQHADTDSLARIYLSSSKSRIVSNLKIDLFQQFNLRTMLSLTLDGRAYAGPTFISGFMEALEI